MSNGARHGLGVVVGLIATAVIYAGLLFGTERVLRNRQITLVQFRDKIGSEGIVAIVVFFVVAAVIAILVGSRISPVASLIPGLALTLYGLPWLIKPVWTADKMPDLPDKYDLANLTLSPMGIPLLIGLILLLASVIPSRWRPSGAPVAAQAARYGVSASPPPAPAGPPAPAPMYGRDQMPQPPYAAGQGAPPRSYGNAPGSAAPPPYGPSQPYEPPRPYESPGGSPGQPGGSQQPRSGAVPFSDGSPSDSPPPAGGAKPKPSQSDAGEPGEWTQMYGGDDLKGDR
ncbi:hypothetical protein J4573_33265 [Actinomadura barringtoniae]|uniref:Uncharacterized protein n=1 Tax=Actinomadura barringtoniae TaxID=1427535 RepID=A0A939PGT4_9ACTN|nr:hypothetical protein [Actinomadura barringtoniae]MBO2451997.1 hypothetical protein [Actinomadura barringtoniae]